MQSLDIVTLSTYGFLFAMCLIAAIVDVATKKIPNIIPGTLLFVWVVATAAKWLLSNSKIIDLSLLDVFQPCVQQIIAAVSVFCVLTISIKIVAKLRKNRGMSEQTIFGAGDIKMSVAICLYFGYIGSFVFVFVSCVLLIIFALISRWTKSKKFQTYPFGPFMFFGVCAAIACLLTLPMILS